MPNFDNTPSAAEPQQPTITDYLAPVVEKIRDRLPDTGTTRTTEALIDWWIDMQQTRQYNEQPRMVSVIGRADRYRWLDPYFERLANTLLTFGRLRRRFQIGILEVRKENIFWRGDTEQQFRRVIMETRRFRKLGPEKLIREKQRIGRILTGMLS